MSNEQKLRTLWKSPGFWLVLLIIFAIPLLADFNARLGYIRQMTAEAANLRGKIDQEKERQAALLALRDYSQSNEFVEHWAREAGMTRANETAIKPSAIASTPAVTTTAQLPAPVPNSPSQEWAALFLDVR
jgi:cell division protein FtsB